MKRKSIVLLLALISLSINQGNTQTVDISSTTDGIVIPRMTESQRDMISINIEGMLLYQTDEAKGFYFNNGTSWIKLSDLKDTNANIKINGADPSNLDLTYIGRSRASSGSAISQQFVNSKGFYIDILNNDSLAHSSIFFTESGDCSSGKMYNYINNSGRGSIVIGIDELLYIPREAPIIAEVSYMSNMTFGLDGSRSCHQHGGTAKLVYEFLINDPIITGITLNPQDGFRVTFGN